MDSYGCQVYMFLLLLVLVIDDWSSLSLAYNCLPTNTSTAVPEPNARRSPFWLSAPNFVFSWGRVDVIVFKLRAHSRPPWPAYSPNFLTPWFGVVEHSHMVQAGALPNLTFDPNVITIRCWAMQGISGNHYWSSEAQDDMYIEMVTSKSPDPRRPKQIPHI